MHAEDPVFLLCSPSWTLLWLAAGDGSDNGEGLLPRCDGFGEGSIHRGVGEVFFAGVEPQEWAALLGDMVTDRSAQYRVASLDCIQHGAHRYRPCNINRHLAFNAGQGSQMKWKDDADHVRNAPGISYQGIGFSRAVFISS